jgi:hypothetical protein
MHLPRLFRSRPARLLLAVALATAAAAPVLAAPPSDADVNRLLAASRAQTMLDGMLPQMERCSSSSSPNWPAAAR